MWADTEETWRQVVRPADRSAELVCCAVLGATLVGVPVELMEGTVSARVRAVTHAVASNCSHFQGVCVV